jgi:uncharacterized membrane protein/mono/diheme cytochrome c family protein
MPPHRGEISDQRIGDLVAYIRAFARTRERPRDTEKTGPNLARFDQRFGRLEREMNDLRQEYHKLPQVAPGGTPSTPPQTGQNNSAWHSAPAAPGAPAVAAPGAPAVAELFRKRCVKCHGEDGTGKKARDRLSEIPDFTNPSWQARRADSKLLSSILNGKGEDMPAQRGKISEEQARGLITYVRAFAPTGGSSKQEKQHGPTQSNSSEASQSPVPVQSDAQSPDQAEQEGPALAEPEEAEPAKSRLGKLIRWLGNFHPPAVHFPIALLTAAAVAELLGIATGKPAFEAITRYCVWFGALTAMVAGPLGWCLGGFHLTDASWVKMMHRWLGTSTVAFAGLALALCEVSRAPNRQRARMWFRATLLIVVILVSVTGFLGGALVFGLDHYDWPQ